MDCFNNSLYMTPLHVSILTASSYPIKPVSKETMVSEHVIFSSWVKSVNLAT